MAEEPENLTLVLLREMRAENQAQAKLLGKAMDAIMELAKDVKGAREDIGDLSERLQTVEGRLNTIDSRLARIEKHTGLVKA